MIILKAINLNLAKIIKKREYNVEKILFEYRYCSPKLFLIFIIKYYISKAETAIDLYCQYNSIMKDNK